MRFFLVMFAGNITMMNTNKLYRSKSKKIAGVCAGLADYFKVNPTLVRILFVIFTWTYLVGLFLYLLMWMVVPVNTETTLD